MTRNPIVQMLTVVALTCAMVIVFCWIATCLSGCSVNATEAAIDQVRYGKGEDKLAAVETLGGRKDDASLVALVDAFREDHEVREAAAKELVRRGRYCLAHDVRKGGVGTSARRSNPVAVLVGEIPHRQGIHVSVRAKAVWVLGEIGRFQGARKLIESAPTYQGDGSIISKEVAISLAKIGCTDAVHEMEMLGEADGYKTVADYDPAERGHIEEVE